MGDFFVKYMFIAVLTVLLCSCAVKPPVQEMSEARSAIEKAQQLNIKSPKANKVLKSAEQSLKEAASAIDEKHYQVARRKAVEAKRKAQLAAKIRHTSSDK
ncbi:MAG: DUF4398 domain-containing protein [Mariprofundaceae bacterium]